ncbi:MAG: chemotaxis protein CheR [Polaromonas sp. 39-63-203]|jgi:chemotaxis protein methyltransferase CheR|uniref:CheR family methyltransferase n=1 Tax=Polaromonas sp. TaxID=1869339 RepID=UPI000BCD48DF|nr:CheR family methyltransferase [Polaromonas sp.]OYY53588.1 MAG: chemotaxis protein CheR [Polaromonas sp. 35-63-240]OYZ03251.1 MAG: chemotaxis protein CheR [Polaromonas sp. 28-63-22]OYZ85020.1 MAG: chemotaxis protein CheR [Polaromonas sp. 24-62-144]OZB02368.1 MAG: chemotaxis protein CheR [Polaromonas sp. 39-63-203]HQS32648.1 CheR family methyltransferase [Polaromonas sp.]
MNTRLRTTKIPAVSPDFLLTDHDFSRIRTLIHERAGIALGAQKRQMVYSRLARRLRELSLKEFSAYLSFLESDPNSAEWQLFTNALTTNLTAFFREAHHFPVLAEHARSCSHPLTVWCSAASTGEEPYSIAMTLVEALGSRASSASVVATDIDTQVLSKATEGVFTMEQVCKLSPERLRRFFLKGSGAQAGLVRIRPEVAAMVKFSRLNLLDPRWALNEPFDAIFCRNVMIYFDKPTQAKILDRFALLMKPHALLFAGHSENFSFASRTLRLRGQTVYELASERGKVAA